MNKATDWVYQKMEERMKGKPKVNYTRLDKKQAALTAVRVLGITPLAINAVWITTDQFINAPGLNVSSIWGCEENGFDCVCIFVH